MAAEGPRRRPETFIGVDRATGLYIYCFYNRVTDRTYCFLRDPATNRWVRFLRVIYVSATCTFDSGRPDRHYRHNLYVESQVVVAIPYNFSPETQKVLAADCAADPQVIVFGEPYGLVAKGPDDIRNMLSDAGDIAAQRCRCCFDQFGVDYDIAGYEVRSARPPTYCCKAHFDVTPGGKVIRFRKCYDLVCEPRCREYGGAPGG